MERDCFAPISSGLAMTTKELNTEDIGCWWWGSGAYLGLEVSPEPQG